MGYNVQNNETYFRAINVLVQIYCWNTASDTAWPTKNISDQNCIRARNSLQNYDQRLIEPFDYDWLTTYHRYRKVKIVGTWTQPLSPSN